MNSLVATHLRVPETVVVVSVAVVAHAAPVGARALAAGVADLSVITWWDLSC